MEQSDRDLVELFQRIRAAEPDRLTPIFQRHEVLESKGVEALVEMIRRDGSNSFASAARGGEGVHYSEIVKDVAKEVSVNVVETATVEAIEERLVEKIIQDYYESCTSEQRIEMDSLVDTQRAAAARHGAIPLAGKTALVLALRFAGVSVVKQVVRRVVTWQMTRFAAFFAARRAASAAAAAIPVVNVFLAAWMVNDFAGAAMRKTIPTVIEVALLRTEFPPTR